MVKQLPISFALLFIAGVAFASDNERDRKARVALALAATERKPTAPAPHAVPLPGYAEGYRLALEKREPLVVYVGCDGRHPVERLPNVVVSATVELSGYERGSVVVGYPRDGKLLVHATLRCPDHGEPVAKATEEARKKISAPAATPVAAPIPLNWNVRAGPPCVCASSCPCANGVCPLKCPVAPSP